MVEIFLELAFYLTAATAGVLGGMWLRRKPVEVVSQSCESSDLQQARADADAQSNASQQVLAKLHDLALRMQTNVGQHSSRMQEISEGLHAQDSPEKVVAAVEELIAANTRMQAQLASAESRLQQQAAQIESAAAEARTDALTMLANRRAFDAEMARCAAQLQRRGRPSCVMIFDVDHFKNFNDQHGHQAGDEVLRDVARVLRDNVSGEQLAARYGGEEFAIVFGGESVDEARDKGERARAEIAHRCTRFDGKELYVTASAGIAEIRVGEDVAECIRRADEALYESKKNGRDQAFWHDGKKSYPIDKYRTEADLLEDVKVLAAETAQSLAGPDETDRVTGLSSQSTFMLDIRRRASEWKRGGPLVSIMMAEIDSYDEIRTNYGEQGVQKVLRAAAQLMKGVMREMDHVARFDERRFALMLPTATVQETCQVGERLRRAMSSCRLMQDGKPLSFTISIVAAQLLNGEDAADLIQRVSSRLAEIVHTSKDRVVMESSDLAEAENSARQGKSSVSATRKPSGKDGSDEPKLIEADT